MAMKPKGTPKKAMPAAPKKSVPKKAGSRNLKFPPPNKANKAR